MRGRRPLLSVLVVHGGNAACLAVTVAPTCVSGADVRPSRRARLLLVPMARFEPLQCRRRAGATAASPILCVTCQFRVVPADAFPLSTLAWRNVVGMRVRVSLAMPMIDQCVARAQAGQALALATPNTARRSTVRTAVCSVPPSFLSRVWPMRCASNPPSCPSLCATQHAPELSAGA